MNPVWNRDMSFVFAKRSFKRVKCFLISTVGMMKSAWYSIGNNCSSFLFFSKSIIVIDYLDVWPFDEAATLAFYAFSLKSLPSNVKPKMSSYIVSLYKKLTIPSLKAKVFLLGFLWN